MKLASQGRHSSGKPERGGRPDRNWSRRIKSRRWRECEIGTDCRCGPAEGNPDGGAFSLPIRSTLAADVQFRFPRHTKRSSQLQ
ncbi:hypothetical protein PVAP13_9NG296973 [Panicum virgatum]|uniref:Uncharacterized protein n=1 Tax=Panicum virgatum TaxID=38727 RepID=A0A8T0MQ15_PANVG|nr:hypothetical protein PVAP13_9NG296973 [Panicum virgatum]